jgi:DNA-binding LacI/PurR family transcriptional regulator
LRLHQPRIVDVAHAAGVSPATVSNALTGKRPVSAAADAKVRAAVVELGYRGNALARGLRTQRTQTVALVIPDINNPFYPVVARGVQDAVSDAGYQVVVCSTDGDPARERSYIEDMVARSVDGIILGILHDQEATLRGLADASVSVVMLGPSINPPVGDRVTADNRIITAEATRHLLRGGRRQIAFVGGEHRAGPADDRQTGYEDALFGAGIAIDRRLIVTNGYTRSSGVAAIRDLIAAGIEFDSVMAVNDLAAIGVLDALRAAGRTVPDDVAVIGFDDIDAAALVHPSLTTVDNRAYEKGALCGRLIMQRLSGELTGPFREIVVPGSLVLRESA